MAHPHPLEDLSLKQSSLKLASLFGYASVALAADQALKIWVDKNLDLHTEQVALIPGWFALTYTRNFGSAWSMLWGQRGLLILIASAVAIGIIVYAIRLKERSWIQMAGLGFLLGGAVGNLIDRARLGYVIDMFNLQNGRYENIFPIFNVADIAIDIGVGLLLLFTYMVSRREKAEAKAAQEAASRPVEGTP
jgi:signal peptidase II